MPIQAQDFDLLIITTALGKPARCLIIKVPSGNFVREDKEKDAFVHISAVKEAGISKLFENDKLEFELQDGPKGPSAVNLKKID